MSVWNEKMKINLLNSGFCRGFSKTEDEKEILCFLQSIKEKILLARIKR
jgi:hypothetical protein